MADIYFFLKMGIKSYIEQSFSLYFENTKFIFNRNFDNNFLHPLFINNMSLYKDLIQKNKLKADLWRTIGNLLDNKINQILLEYRKIIEDMKNKVLKYTEIIAKSNEKIEKYEEQIEQTENKLLNFCNLTHNNKIKKNKNKKVKEKEELIEKEYNLSLELVYLKELNRKLQKEKEDITSFKSKLEHKKKYSEIGDINLLKLEIMKISLYILINEINELESKNINYSKNNSYKLLISYINDFIDKSEKYKDINNNGHYTFLRACVIEEAIIINLQGYKDINKSFLKLILYSIYIIQMKYSNSHISYLIKSIQEIISNPEKILCPNAFQILKEASFKKIKPRSRDNSFDENDLINKDNNNAYNKNERNRKIDEYFNLKKDEKSDNDDNEEGFLKKRSNIISFKNSSIHNHNLNSNLIQNNYNYNIISQDK